MDDEIGDPGGVVAVLRRHVPKVDGIIEHVEIGEDRQLVISLQKSQLADIRATMTNGLTEVELRQLGHEIDAGIVAACISDAIDDTAPSIALLRYRAALIVLSDLLNNKI
ncbi:MAG: hypothetical protein HOO67_04780 [Candidatus Peribacteraceae bacterium]|nr:hypothetical protein [Candidatus Peribacteraceae bacterium]